MIARQMENLEYARICSELHHLCGCRLDNIYQTGDKTFRLRIGKADIVCTLGLRLHETKYIPKTSPQPSNLVMLLRSRLRGRKVESIQQIRNDRIVEFTISGKEGNYHLILEMFGQGNLILIDENQTIIRAFEQRIWNERELLPGRKYTLPPTTHVSPNPTLEELKMEVEKKYAIANFSKIPLGTLYIREVLARSGIEEREDASTIDESRLMRLLQNISLIRAEDDPAIYLDTQNTPIQFSAAKLSILEGKFERRETETLSEAADEYYIAILQEKDKKEEELEEQIKKLSRRIEVQEEEVRKLEKEIAKNSAFAKAIYENFDSAEKKIEEARARGEKKAYLEI
ncbi:MAG: NFACT family protein [Candidatus Anstonellales archaeon]